MLPEINFIWIGEGELKTELTSPNITITGWIKREEALRIIRNVDFFILPSLTKQIFLKYIASSNDIGNPSHNDGKIKNGVNGLICNLASEYADAIKKIVSGQIDGKKMSNVASYDIVKNYNIDLMAQKYSEIYEDKRKEKNNYIKQI